MHNFTIKEKGAEWGRGGRAPQRELGERCEGPGRARGLSLPGDPPLQAAVLPVQWR